MFSSVYAALPPSASTPCISTSSARWPPCSLLLHSAAAAVASALLLQGVVTRARRSVQQQGSIGSLVIDSRMEDAAARRERLKALRAAQQLAQQGEGGDVGGTGPPQQQQQQEAAAAEEPEKPVLKFRNYAVKDQKNIEHEKVAPAQPPKLAADLQLGTKPEEADEEVSSGAQLCMLCVCLWVWVCMLATAAFSAGHSSLHHLTTSSPASCGFIHRPLINNSSPPTHQELLASMAPKKANWDLKREVEPRLARLERRTQRALVEIMLAQEQQQLAEEGGAAD